MEPALIPSPSASDITEQFGRYQRLTVRQKKRWLEILLSFEVKNTYEVFDERGAASLRVREQGQGFLSLLKRVFLGPMRPFEVHVTDIESGATLLRLHRPFRFFFHRLEVKDAQGRLLGAIQKRWSWLRRIYTIEQGVNLEAGQLYGPILRPWTFEIRVAGQSVGTIQKRWSGFAKEMFSDADNFGVDLSAIRDASLKVLAFAAIVLIDIVHFENSK
jgi:uncharacterized protein YxjI